MSDEPRPDRQILSFNIFHGSVNADSATFGTQQRRRGHRRLAVTALAVVLVATTGTAAYLWRPARSGELTGATTSAGEATNTPSASVPPTAQASPTLKPSSPSPRRTLVGTRGPSRPVSGGLFKNGEFTEPNPVCVALCRVTDANRESPGPPTGARHWNINFRSAAGWVTTKIKPVEGDRSNTVMEVCGTGALWQNPETGGMNPKKMRVKVRIRIHQGYSYVLLGAGANNTNSQHIIFEQPGWQDVEYVATDDQGIDMFMIIPPPGGACYDLDYASAERAG